MLYLLHFTVPLQRSNGTAAEHYLGYCSESGLDERLTLHRKGHSRVRILQEVLRRGGDFVLVKTWPNGGPALEQYLKQQGHLKQFCPICRPQHLKNAREKQKRSRQASSSLRELPTARQQTFSGIGVLVDSRGRAASSSTGCLHAPPLASSTGSGAGDPPRPGSSIGGRATAEPGNPEPTASAGTEPPST